VRQGGGRNRLGRLNYKKDRTDWQGGVFGLFTAEKGKEKDLLFQINKL
jgi:hypothetical protein